MQQMDAQQAPEDLDDTDEPDSAGETAEDSQSTISDGGGETSAVVLGARLERLMQELQSQRSMLHELRAGSAGDLGESLADVAREERQQAALQQRLQTRRQDLARMQQRAEVSFILISCVILLC